MNIHLNQTEIYTALKDYIINQGIDLAERTIEIQLTAGRAKKNGFYADIQLNDQDSLANSNSFVDTVENAETETTVVSVEDNQALFDD